MNGPEDRDTNVTEDAFARLLVSVSDGTAIDWEKAEKECRDEDERRLLRSLRIIAGVSGFHADPAAPFRPGGRWAHLEIGPCIGRGEWGEVYRARDTRLRRDVAVKFLSRATRVSGAAAVSSESIRLGIEGDAPDPMAAGESFLEEARRLARIRHPNVVQVHSVETAEGPAGLAQAALVLEYIQGQTLAELVRNEGRRGATEVIATGVEICHALAAVHAAGLVHQDLKAQNVMREDGGRVVLMDFAPGGATPLYMAPELFRGSPASPSTDLYGAGVLLFHLSTGSFPVSGRDLEELRAQHARGVRALLRDARPDFPPDLVETLERAIAADPAKRFATAGEMERALAACLWARPDAAVGGTRAGPRGPADRQGTRRRPTWWDPTWWRPTRKRVTRQRTTRQRTTPQRPAWQRPTRRRATVVWSGLGLAILVVAVLTGVFASRSLRNGKSVPAGARAREQATGVSSSAPATPADPGFGRATEASPSASVPSAAGAAVPPYTIEAGFWSGRGQRTRLHEGSRIAPGDSISLSLRASGDVFVYVINQDEHGEAYLLFPAPHFDTQNPLPRGARYILPGRRADKEAYWRVTSAGGRERLLVVASPRRLTSLEREVSAMSRPEKDAPVEYARVVREKVADELRGLGGYVELKSGAPAASPPSGLFELAEGLPPGPEDARGVWIRKLELENPGR